MNPGTLLIYIGFIDVPIPVRAEIYFFEIRNGPQFLEGTPANLHEIGPFVFEYVNIVAIVIDLILIKIFYSLIFRISRKRQILSWTNTTVIFREKFTAKFDQESSPHSIERRMTTINVPITVI